MQKHAGEREKLQFIATARLRGCRSQSNAGAAGNRSQKLLLRHKIALTN